MVFVLFFLILSSALLSASETALFSLSPLSLKSYKSSHDKALQRIATCMEHPRDVLVTLLMLNILANILVQNTVSALFGPSNDWILKVGFPLGLTLIFGEILPKSMALPNNVAWATRVAPWVEKGVRLFKPIRDPLTHATHWISRLLFFFLKKEAAFSADELRHIVQSSAERGVLLPQESDLIYGTLDLQDSLVKERMRPREEVLYYDIQEPLSKLFHLFIDLETTRVPICDGSLEGLIGILSTRRFFLHRDQIHEGEHLRAIVKRPYFVPETTKAWTLLKNLREKQEDLAIVVDEYGAISGLITQEDLIEAVVGEITDRRDPRALYTRSGEDVIIASGKLELSEFKDIFNVALRSRENIVTLGGWLVEQLGDIPAAGTKYVTDQFLFYVLAALPNRVQRIYVRQLHDT